VSCELSCTVVVSIISLEKENKIVASIFITWHLKILFQESKDNIIQMLQTTVHSNFTQ
jgi:hypothetical protein